MGSIISRVFKKRSIRIFILCFSWVTIRDSAQTTLRHVEDPKLSFSVVSVRPSVPGACRPTYQIMTDGLKAGSYPLYALINLAFGLKDPRSLVGVPEWAHDECFDVLAKVDEVNISYFNEMTRDDKAKLLRQVLSERFGMKSHIETREFPVWALVVAKDGPKLKLATGTTEAGGKLTWQITGRYKLDAKNASMENLCHMLLSTEAQEYTVDETHLDGLYDFTLTWTRPNQEGTYDAPEIFAAVKEQLGLELVKRKVAEPVMIVDEIHRPTPN